VLCEVRTRSPAWRDALTETQQKNVQQSVPEFMRSLGQSYLNRRYAILFYALAFTIVASPVAASLGLSGNLVELLLGISMLAAVMPVARGKWRSVLLALVAASCLARSVTALTGHPRLSQMTLSVWTLIGLLAAVAALRFAMRGARVDAEHLFAALSAYLLAGLYFGLLDWTAEQIHPGTISASNFSRTGAIYYSFVTLATIGYGDIVPRTDIARGLAIVEGVGGQLFLAVLVARLLSMYSGRERD
jgi:voltage-gated potassium channel